MPASRRPLTSDERDAAWLRSLLARPSLRKAIARATRGSGERGALERSLCILQASD